MPLGITRGLIARVTRDYGVPRLTAVRHAECMNVKKLFESRIRLACVQTRKTPPRFPRFKNSRIKITRMFGTTCEEMRMHKLEILSLEICMKCTRHLTI